VLLKEVIAMGSSTKQTISAQIPVELATAVEQLALELDRSKSWIIKEALTAMLAERERRHQSIQAGLDDVTEGKVISHAEMMNFASQLKKE
jgi:predicted transcriptional regulator